MRVIEKQITDYLKNKEFENSFDSIKSKELSTRDTVITTNTQKRFYLWTSCIFVLDKENNVRFSFCGYQTNTTKNRINALLKEFVSCNVCVYQKNGELFYNSDNRAYPIDVYKTYTIQNGTLEEFRIK